MFRILIVEDDETIASLLKKHISEWGFEVECVTDFKEVLSQFVSFAPQLVLLDISLPYYNGFHWCSQIRSVSKVPIVFLSSASDNMNIIMAMNMGADDFVAKPFDYNVLMAKIQALLRRSYDFAGQLNLLEHKGIVLNLNDLSFAYGGKNYHLSKNEFRILQILLENTGKVVSREAMMTRLWESDSYVDDNTLTVNVTRIRKKLEDAGITDFIQTVKGVGYRIE